MVCFYHYNIVTRMVFASFVCRLLYQSLVGGVVAVTWQDFLRLNGFSNQYFGWGGEDDDFYVRISQSKLDIIRYPLAISRYTMVQHHRDAGNHVNEDR